VIKNLLFGLLILTVAVISILTACSPQTSTSTTTSIPKPITTTSTVQTQPSIITTPVTSTKALTTATVTTKTTTGQGNWWDKFGKPEYGGTITVRTASFFAKFNTWDWMSLRYWNESLFENNWKEEDRSSFTTLFVSQEYWQGLLVESWEWKDPQTLIMRIHKGIHWQDKPPVNGRELTANDIQTHFDWLMGKGAFTQPSPNYLKFIASWDKATATDNYTLEMKFKTPTVVLNLWNILERTGTKIEAPEMINQPSLFDDWKNATGTGPWMLTDFAAGTSITLNKNLKYWGRDERYPENQLPYADQIKILCIPDAATAVAAMRTGKIDIMTKLNWQQADTILKTNPDLQMSTLPWMGNAVNMRCDTRPFKDIIVRKALQMSIDRTSIAKNYFGGYVNGKPAGLVAPALKGYCYAYDEWPQTLKDEYSYNPEKAKQLLAQAGYPGGFNTDVVASSADDLPLLQIIKSYFADIGVNMDIRTMDPAAHNAFIVARKHDQMYLFTNTASHMPPSMLIFMRVSTNPQNGGMNNDPAYDALYKQFNLVSDAEEAKTIMREADEYVITHHWSVNVSYTVQMNILQPYIKGYTGECADYIGDNPFYWARIWVKK
jgi:peptide/nickel transport system substrate-binding protein